VKPKLLIIELWGLGDLVIATPLLQAAAETHEVTLLAKPGALELQPRFWPGITVIPFVAPWTVFRGKYRVWDWPLRQMQELRNQLADAQFDAGASARWDPRDHLLLKLVEARQRLGFPRAGSERLLTHPLPRPEATFHRYEYWRRLGRELGIALPEREALPVACRTDRRRVTLHSGARLDARIWPLENYRGLVARLRANGWQVKVLCDPNQLGWWSQAGENAAAPHSVADLCAHLDHGDLFIGNCSGPGHLAAILGLPTFTLFGPSLPEWFLPLHPLADYVEGPACPFRPCSDYCHFDRPRCLTELTVATVWNHLEPFLHRVSAQARPAAGSALKLDSDQLPAPAAHPVLTA